jgi:DNA processing protein
VAGLADAIFLPEAGEKSGSLITADFGIHMHKPVYGTPNTIFSSSSDGLHRMIQQGLIKPVFALSTMLDAHFGKHIYT